MLKQLLSLAVVLVFATDFFGQIKPGDFQSREPIGNLMQYQLTDTSVNSPARLNESEWESILTEVPNFNVTKKAVWLKFTLVNNQHQTEYIIDVAQPQLEYVEFFTESDDGQFSSQKSGFFQRFAQREIPNQNYCFPISVPYGQQRVYYLKILSGGQIQVPVYIGTPEQTDLAHNGKDIFFGLFSGVLLAMLVYNLFIFVFSRERSYLLYVVYIGIVYATQANFQGYTIRFFWPDFPFLEYNATTILSCLAGISATLFFIDFVHLKEFAPKSLKWLYGFMVSYSVTIVLAVSGQPQAAYVLLQVNAFFLAILLLVLAVWLFRAGVRQALYFLVAWSVFLLGVCVFILKDFGVVPYNNFTYNIMSVGSALEAVFLSIALAERINVLKREKEESRTLAFKAMRENETIIKRQNEILEEKVSSRTIELQRSNFDLTKAMTDLKNAQIKLVENEKMASLGQLVAGVAHELNNPINFISSNVSPLRRDITEYLELADMIAQADANTDANLLFAQLKVAQGNIQNEGLKVEIESLLRGIEEGAERSAEIVKGLRIFSRLDEQDLKQANINDCVKSTSAILKTLLRNKVKLVKELGDIDPIDCYPGKVNQVLMNIINNAYHAIQATGKVYPEAVIQISTRQTNDEIVLSIKDNGIGMSEETKNRIFDPFFTTKEVGEGTGLGMSIVLGIIKDHKGRIEVNSSMGTGTEIVLFLPRNLSV